MGLLGKNETKLIAGTLGVAAAGSLAGSVAQSAHVVNVADPTVMAFAAVGFGAAAFGASLLDQI